MIHCGSPATAPATDARRLLSLLIIPLVFACASREAPSAGPSREPRNVLLLVIDTLRADHMSLYGYERSTTPHIEAFARTAATFERAYSPSSWTRSSIATYFLDLFGTLAEAYGLAKPPTYQSGSLLGAL